MSLDETIRRRIDRITSGGGELEGRTKSERGLIPSEGCNEQHQSSVGTAETLTFSVDCPYNVNAKRASR